MLMLTPILLHILPLIIYYDAGEFPLCSGEKDCSSQSTGSEENWLWCPSGTKTYRDGFNNCEFKQCDDPRCVLEDYKQCPSPNLNVYVARDPKAGNSGCQDYLPCPGSGTPSTMSVNCPQDIKTCPDTQMLNRDPTNNCEFLLTRCCQLRPQQCSMFIPMFDADAHPYSLAYPASYHLL